MPRLRRGRGEQIAQGRRHAFSCGHTARCREVERLEESGGERGARQLEVTAIDRHLEDGSGVLGPMGEEIPHQLEVLALERHAHHRGTEEPVRGIDVGPALDEQPRRGKVPLLGRKIERGLAVAGRCVDRRPGGEQRLDPRHVPGTRRFAEGLTGIVGAGCGHRGRGDKEESEAEEESATAGVRDGHGVPPEKVRTTRPFLPQEGGHAPGWPVPPLGRIRQLRQRPDWPLCATLAAAIAVTSKRMWNWDESGSSSS